MKMMKTEGNNATENNWIVAIEPLIPPIHIKRTPRDSN
jgi:hypothetical protein